jgi:hypothetical protein
MLTENNYNNRGFELKDDSDDENNDSVLKIKTTLIKGEEQKKFGNRLTDDSKLFI